MYPHAESSLNDCTIAEMTDILDPPFTVYGLQCHYSQMQIHFILIK